MIFHVVRYQMPPAHIGVRTRCAVGVTVANHGAASAQKTGTAATPSTSTHSCDTTVYGNSPGSP